MSSLKIFFSLFLLLIFYSCREKSAEKNSNSGAEKVVFVGLSETGGQLGYYKVIKVTRDSIHLKPEKRSLKNIKNGILRLTAKNGNA